ncbi:CDP-glycerol glycerophosphotransferase family protein [Haladaptatus caseinilyticus]|uniref:CDP-glycerol glycerophosphotransferase family protein n=1 Tax=Haladaptatus caseinilyticus TaxID=2993314 RepID=UPI00224B4714|nr:CDP-glycerol glycerophosphotransferase family protein [Haladaptatus caseinilyticus]
MKVGQSILATVKQSLHRPLSEIAERWSPILLVQWMLYALLKRLSGVWTRDDSLWVFGARDSEAFVDNAKYLYLHVANERTGVRPVWLSKNRRVVRELRASGYEAYHCYSIRGLVVNLRAGVICLTQGHRDVTMACCAGAKTVLLWHGIPLKTISWDAEFSDESAPVKAVLEYMADEFDRLVVPGQNLIEIFESGLHLDAERTTIVGYPRLDALFRPPRGSHIGTDETARKRVERLSRDHPVLFYLPTFRDGTDGSSADHLDFRALDEFLAEKDAFLVIKTHPREQFEPPPNLSRIVRLPERCDVYPLLRHADVLVTDYSSIYFDYLVLDRPAVFYPYDRTQYEETRGFYFDYDTITAGPVVTDFDELLDALSRTLENDPFGTERRNIVNELLTDVSHTGRQSAAVYDAIRRELIQGNANRPDDTVRTI